MIHSRIYLDFFIRDKFTDDTGFTEMYIMDECAKSFRIVYGLQKYSLFREKFGTLINVFQVIIKWSPHTDSIENVLHLL